MDLYSFTTASSQKAVIDAYSLSVQGFFVKQNKMEELNKMAIIMEYWTHVLLIMMFKADSTPLLYVNIKISQ